MSDVEQEPESTHSFLNVTRNLKRGEKCLLFKDRVELIDSEGVLCGSLPVHYRDLMYVSEIDRPLGSEQLVTYLFKDKAERIVAERELRNPKHYPLLTVINDETDEQTQEVFDVARLVSVGRLPVYLKPELRNSEGEVLALGVESLVRNMAGKVQVPSTGVLVRLDEVATTIQEAVPVIETRVPLGMGEMALLLLQMKASEMFTESMCFTNEHPSEQAQVAMRVFSEPDLNDAMHSLIDVVTKWGGRVVYENDVVTDEKRGSLLWATTSPTEKRPITLAHEDYLDMTVLVAHLAVIALQSNQ